MKLSALSLKKGLTNVAVMAVLLVTPLIGICQPPPPNEGGGNPEVPLGTPLMSMIFLAAGILFAVIITVRQLRKKASVTA